MRFNRRLNNFKAISFDLDDTLYSNAPVMEKTEQAMITYFDSLLGHKSQRVFDYRFWFEFKLAAISENPNLRHDVGELRRQSYYLGLKALGFSEKDALTHADLALSFFLENRTDFTLSDEIHKLLEQLAQQWPLYAVSNGNADTEKLGIKQYFSGIYHANLKNKQKPDPDMFHKVCAEQNIKAGELLHVGDCGYSDIYGANAAGCQTVWISCYDVGKQITRLPTCEITDIYQLSTLIKI